MNSFINLKNALIQKVDNESSITQIRTPLKNTLKRIINVSPAQIFGSGVYNQKFIFDIPRTYDNLAQIYIKCTLSTSQNASTVETGFATKIFQQILLKTRSGRILGELFPQYILSRIDEVFTTSLYSHLSNSIEKDGEFVNGNVTVYVPCFFFFSHENCFLKTRILEPLTLECSVNSTKESMGMSFNLSSAIFELNLLYFDENTSSKINDQLLTVKTSPSRLIGSYNVFKEDNVSLLTGATSARLLIRCGHPAMNINVSIVDALTNRYQIKTMTMTCAGDELFKLNYRNNYTLFGSETAFLEHGTLTYWFSKLKCRYTDSGLITFCAPFYPTYIDLTFDALSSNAILYTFLEYRTNHSIDSRGMISLSNDQDLLVNTNKYLQNNDSVQAPNLTTLSS